MRTLVALLAMTASAGASEIEDAMKRVGPAYMCGPPYAFAQSLDSLKREILAAGMPEILAQYTIDGLRDFVETNHAAKRRVITAEECAANYSRTPQ